MSNQNLIKQFDNELRQRVSLKTQPGFPEHQVLLDSFKYYDFNRTNFVDYAGFKKVATVKLGISVLTDKEIQPAFYFYSENNPKLNYRDFVAQFYGRSLPNSVRTRHQETNSHRNQVDVVKQEKGARKILEFMIFLLSKKPLSSFIRLYKAFKTQDMHNDSNVNLTSFVNILNTNGIEINFREIESVFDFFKEEESTISYEKFFDFLTVNYNRDRTNAVRSIFEQFSRRKDNRVDVVLVRELFNPKQFFSVQSGQKNMIEMKQQFDDFINCYIDMMNKESLVNAHRFVFLFKFLSPHVKRDDDFVKLADYGFKFNEVDNKTEELRLRQTGDYKKNYDISYDSSNMIPFDKFCIELAKRGRTVYIRLFKILLINDYDKDGFLYLKDFEKAMAEMKMGFEFKEIDHMYKQFCKGDIKMDLYDFIDSIVTPFDDKRYMMAKDLYERILEEEKTKELSFEGIQVYIDQKNHPDIRNRTMNEYEVKKELVESLKSFLLSVQGSYQTFSMPIFVRFLEFFAKDWTDDYYKQFILNAFRTRRKSPFADGGDDISVSSYSKSKNMKFYEEYSKKQKSVPQNGQQIYEKRDNRFENMDKPKQQESYSRPKQFEQNKPQREEVHPPQQQQQQQQPVNAFDTKKIIIRTIKERGDISLVLQIEYDLTNKSDKDGNIEFNNFVQVFKNHNLLKGISEAHLNKLYDNSVDFTHRLHVQTFINDIRGQMSEDIENATVDLFDRITPPELDEIPIKVLLSSFNPDGVCSVLKGSGRDKKKAFENMVDLFVILNITIEGKKEIDLDDFLYFFDNFAFFFNDEGEYRRFTMNMFK